MVAEIAHAMSALDELTSGLLLEILQFVLTLRRYGLLFINNLNIAVGDIYKSTNIGYTFIQELKELFCSLLVVQEIVILDDFTMNINIKLIVGFVICVIILILNKSLITQEPQEKQHQPFHLSSLFCFILICTNVESSGGLHNLSFSDHYLVYAHIHLEISSHVHIYAYLEIILIFILFFHCDLTVSSVVLYM